MPVRIKICGLKSVPQALAAVRAGADAIGLNFYRKSPRCIDPAMARDIVFALPPFVDAIGLFVNMPLEDMLASAFDCNLRTVQVHGDEPMPPPGVIRIIPAFPIRDEASVRRLTEYLEACRQHGRMPAAVLVDAHVAGEYGGTGQTAPWELLANLTLDVPLILAGGLTADNVAEAIRVVRPYAVDVASGVESSPGIKDEDLMRAFVAAVREAE